MSLKSKLKHVGMAILAAPLVYGIGWLAVNRQKANPSNHANPNNNLEAKVMQEANEPKSLNYVVRENIAEANAVEDTPETKMPRIIKEYTPQEHKEIQNILYGEVANQSSFTRKTVARVILNRVNSNEYPNNIHDVIFERNAFSCIFSKKNKNWKQAIGELERNGYEERVYGECEKDAKTILDGEILGIERENEIIAYHDISVRYEDLVAKELKLKEENEKQGKKYDGYWINLEPVKEIDDLIIYAPKK